MEFSGGSSLETASVGETFQIQCGRNVRRCARIVTEWQARLYNESQLVAVVLRNANKQKTALENMSDLQSWRKQLFILILRIYRLQANLQ